jgi:hypothetical protein
MNPQSFLPKLRAWFAEYVRRFASEDPVLQENLDLKEDHTRRVCEAILEIGRSLDLSHEDLCLAEACALLHDIGRFEQYLRYRTFADYKSKDHAELGVKAIRTNHALEALDPDAAHVVLRVVKYHNRSALPVGEKERCLFFLKLLRDADKIDIWRVVTEYYRQAGHHRNPTIELDLPDVDRVSARVYDALMKGKLVHVADLNTLHDFKLLQIGWIYDVNFPRTFQIVQERRYLEKIRDTLPQKSSRIAEVYDRARAHLYRNARAYPAVLPPSSVVRAG